MERVEAWLGKMRDEDEGEGELEKSRWVKKNRLRVCYTTYKMLPSLLLVRLSSPCRPSTVERLAAPAFSPS